MRSNLEKRLAALERQFGSCEPIRLTMPDGKIQLIPLPRSRNGGLLKFYGECIQGQHPEAAQLIRDCVEYNEPGGGHLVNLLKVMLESPVETTSDLAALDESE